MLKNILNLEGAKKLSKNEQKSINGGKPVWYGECFCPNGIRLDAGLSYAECQSAKLSQCNDSTN